jgi:hypothetical protein
MGRSAIIDHADNLYAHPYDQQRQAGSDAVGNPRLLALCDPCSSGSQCLSDHKCRRISAEQPQKIGRCAEHRHHVHSHALELRKGCASAASLAVRDGLSRHIRPDTGHHVRRCDDRDLASVSLDRKLSVLHLVPPPAIEVFNPKLT